MPSPRLSGPSEFIPNALDYDLSEIDLLNSPEETQGQIARLLKLGKASILLSDIDRHEAPIKGTFISRDEFGIGRDENGRHDLDFGQLVITSRNRRDMPAFIASKSYERHEIPTLRHEIAATNYMNNLAEIQNSFMPIGVWRNAQGILSMITLYENGVKSFDNTFWVNKDEEPEALRPERLRTAFQDCIWGIGYMHGAGLVHGDAQVKNLAHDGKNVRFIDLEDVSLMPRTSAGKIENSPLSDALRTRDIATFIATSMQVDENRDEIMKVLGGEKSINELALYYRKGLRKGGKDSQLAFEKPMSAQETKDLLEHILNSILAPIIKSRSA